MSENRGQKAQIRGQMSENRGQKTEGRENFRSENRDQKTENRGQRSEKWTEGSAAADLKSDQSIEKKLNNYNFIFLTGSTGWTGYNHT